MWYHFFCIAVIGISTTGCVHGAVVKRESGSEPVPVVCETKGCYKAAERLQQSMNPDVEPCEDFYEFACGGWMKNNPIPESSSSINTWTKLRSEVSAQVEDLITQPITADDLEAVQKLKTLYASCMDEETQNKLGAEPLLDLLDTVGDWPLLNSDWSDEDEDNFDLVDLLLNVRQYKKHFLIAVDVGIDPMNPVSRIIQIDQPSLGMNRDKFDGPKAAQAIPAFTKYAYDVAQALGSQNELLSDDVTALVDFATEVASLTATKTERRYVNDIYNKMTIKELYSNISDKVDWMRFIENVLDPADLGDKVDGSEPVVVFSKEYLINVLDLIEATPKRTVTNYVMWLFVKSLVPELSTDFRLIALEFTKAFSGVTQLTPRNKKCMYALNLMGDVMGRMFVDTYFDESSKQMTMDMISHIRTAFNEILLELDWMDDDTRASAREKADAMNQLIGYSDDIRDDSILNGQFAKLDYKPSTYFQNVLQNSAFVSVKALKLLRVPVDKTQWTTKATTVNAYYNFWKNVMTFPAGILQPPFFNKEYPKSMNYGGIGMLIGHEITHGFDDKGSQYDKDGNFVQWWSEDVIDEFNNRTGCIVDQYGTYFVPEANMTVNGFQTQGENIADNGGLRQAYSAYQTWLTEGQENDPVLPDLSFDRQQLFFLSFAQIWCESLRPEAAVSKILRSNHSPGRIRVIGTLRNFPAFSEAFNCPEESFMNAEKTCRVW